MKPIRKDPAGYKSTELLVARKLAGLIDDFAELFFRDFLRRHPKELALLVKKKPLFQTIPREEFEAIDQIEAYIDANAVKPTSVTVVAAAIAHGKDWADKNIINAGITANGISRGTTALYLPNDPRMVELAEDAMVGEIRGLTGFYATGLKRTLRTAWDNGYTMPEITKAVQEVTGLAKSKAVTIARTETLRAGNTATLERYARAGVQKVEWLSAQDDRMCEECESLHGTVYDIGEEPDLPVHPNCRCTVVPIIEKE